MLVLGLNLDLILSKFHVFFSKGKFHLPSINFQGTCSTFREGNMLVLDEWMDFFQGILERHPTLGGGSNHFFLVHPYFGK